MQLKDGKTISFGVRRRPARTHQCWCLFALKVPKPKWLSRNSTMYYTVSHHHHPGSSPLRAQGCLSACTLHAQALPALYCSHAVLYTHTQCCLLTQKKPSL